MKDKLMFVSGLILCLYTACVRDKVTVLREFVIRPVNEFIYSRTLGVLCYSEHAGI